MEGNKSKEMMMLSELAQIKDLAMQVLVTDQLDRQHSPAEFCRSLAAKMLSSVDRIIRVAMTSDQQDYPWTTVGNPCAAENSAPATFSYNCNSLPKKRKILPRRKVQVKVDAASGGASIAACLDDGYCWRKYGNKSILGARHPRSYYRCKDRVTKGCLVTKQMQRSDADPQVFDIIYLGDHTCRRSSSSCLHTPPRLQPPEELKDYSSVELGAAAGVRSAKTEAAVEAEEAKNCGVFFLGRSSGSASCTTSTPESDCLFDDLYELPAESNPYGDFVLMDMDISSGGWDEVLFSQAFM